MIAPTLTRAAFLTLGQTPRVDLVPELKSWIGPGLVVDEFGALDGLDESQVASLAPKGDEPRMITRLRDGTEVVVRKQDMHQRIQKILERLGPDDYDLRVLLCTGHFPGLEAPGLFLESQTMVDLGVRAVGSGANLLGVLLPLAEQEADFDRRHFEGTTLRFSHASPYRFNRLEQAARELSHADLIVMHCIGYTEAQRRCVRKMAGRPVLLARRLVAAALAQLV